MKDLRQRTIAHTVFLFAALLLSMVGTASAQDGLTCSQASWRGQFGYTFTGTLILPSGPVLFAGVGRETIDVEGNVSATQTTSVGGNVSQNIAKGTIKAGSDCTATFTVNLFDAAGNLLRTATWALVLDDNRTEVRGILTSLVLPSTGASIPTIVTVNAKKQFSGDQQ